MFTIKLKRMKHLMLVYS